MADANETVEATLERANWLFSSGLGGTLGILKEADADLSRRLHRLVTRRGAQDLRFTEAQALAYRQQIRLTQKYMDERLLGHTHAQALKAIGAGTKSTVRLMKKLEKQFTGIAKPLQLDSQAMQDSIVRGTGASLLRQHVTSVARYSTAMIQDFERVMRVGALEGLSQHQVISRLVAQGELGGINAQKLHEQEPGYFPAPTGYVVRRYWAERIVRTETAYALNAANASTIAAAKVTDFPDMQKKILAHFDNRTAPDSIAVHGQIRPVDGLFTDGAGRMYRHPPARPNDREVVIPWRPHWSELPATKQAPPEAQAAAKVEAQPAGLAPASSGQILVPSSNVKAMVAKLKAQHGEQGQDQALAQKFQQALENAQAAKLKGTAAMGAAKLASEKSLARAQALQQVKAAKTPKSLAELKAKADAYKAGVQAKAAAKAAEVEAKAAAALRSRALFSLRVMGEEAADSDKPGPDLVARFRNVARGQPAVFAEMKRQLGVTLKAQPAAALAMAKKLAPELDYSSFAKKPRTKGEQLATAEDFKAAKIELYESVEKTHAMSRKLFGRGLTPDLVRRLTLEAEHLPEGERTHSTKVSVDEQRGQLGISATHFVNGKQVAEVTRKFKDEGSKGTTAYNAYFILSDEMKNQGTGRKILRTQVNTYRELGVKEITLSAAWDGQYVWPRAGYELQSPGRIEVYKQELRTFLKDRQLLEGMAGQVDKVESIHELAILKAKDGTPVGKNFLIRRGNHGGDLLHLQVKLQDGDPGFEIMREYYNL